MPALQQVMADAGVKGERRRHRGGPGPRLLYRPENRRSYGQSSGLYLADSCGWSQCPDGPGWQVGWAGQVVVPMVDARRQTVYTQVFTGLGSGEPTDSPEDPLTWAPAPRRARPGGGEGLVGAAGGPVWVDFHCGGRRGGLGVIWSCSSPLFKQARLLSPRAPVHCRGAAAVVEAGQEYLRKGVTTDPMTLVPLYLRKSEAEN